MFVTTYSNIDGEENVFIRLNQTLEGAVTDAHEDAEATLQEYYTSNGAQGIDFTTGETSLDPTFVRIINPHSGYEYEAYIITEHPVGE